MAARRKVVEISIGEADAVRLQSIARSRTEPASRMERARIMLHYRALGAVFSPPAVSAAGAALAALASAARTTATS